MVLFPMHGVCFECLTPNLDNRTAGQEWKSGMPPGLPLCVSPAAKRLLRGFVATSEQGEVCNEGVQHSHKNGDGNRQARYPTNHSSGWSRSCCPSACLGLCSDAEHLCGTVVAPKVVRSSVWPPMSGPAGREANQVEPPEKSVGNSIRQLCHRDFSGGFTVFKRSQ